MHANDPSIRLTVFILETVLIPFRFSYQLARKLKAIALSNLRRSLHLYPKAGKKTMSRLPTWYFGSGEPPSVGSWLWNELIDGSVQTKSREGTKMSFGWYDSLFSRFRSIIERFSAIEPSQPPPSLGYLAREAEGALTAHRSTSNRRSTSSNGASRDFFW